MWRPRPSAPASSSRSSARESARSRSTVATVTPGGGLDSVTAASPAARPRRRSRSVRLNQPVVAIGAAEQDADRVGLRAAEDDERFRPRLHPLHGIVDRHRLDRVAGGAHDPWRAGLARLRAERPRLSRPRRAAGDRPTCLSASPPAVRSWRPHRARKSAARPSPWPRSMWSPRAWTMISARWRYFSLVRMTDAEMALSLRRRSSLVSRRAMS